MRKTDVVIIGGGQSGLVMSRSLSVRGVDHVVLERGRTGESWYSARWNLLHLLTTNALSALPGLAHNGDPDGFMHSSGFAAYLDRYAARFRAPVVNGAGVLSVQRRFGGFHVHTTAGDWLARAVVVATGACDTPFRPPMAEMLSSSFHQLFPSDYRQPDDLPDGGVLIVGASSTGAQLAEEIHASGRPVILSVGDHTRVPRRYRGRDVYAWMDRAGILDDPALESGNLEAARRQPSLQLVGRPDNRDLNLGVLQKMGIRLMGRLKDMGGVRAEFSDDLQKMTAQSHLRMLRILDRIDKAITCNGLVVPESEPAARDLFSASSLNTVVDLGSEGIKTVIWATGYVRRYPWLHLPALDAKGEIIHRGGVTAVPGLYVLGLTFLRRRRSSFIDGCGRDADELALPIKNLLGNSRRQAA